MLRLGVKIVQVSRRWIAEGEEGVTAVEYALLTAVIAVLIIGALTALGNQIAATFNTISAVLP